MFNLFDEETNEFDWQSIGDINNGRQNLGEDMPVFLFRLFQYNIKNELLKYHDKETVSKILRDTGRSAGVAFAKKLLNLDLPTEDFLDNVSKVFNQCKIANVRIEDVNNETGEITLAVYDDVSCSGVPVTGETVCKYDEGVLEGIFQTYSNKNYYVKEIDCWATGAKICRFNAKIQ